MQGSIAANPLGHKQPKTRLEVGTKNPVRSEEPKLTLELVQKAGPLGGYTCDAAGNLTADGVYTYQWDAEGRLKSVANGNTWSATFNALGQRVQQVWPSYRQEVTCPLSPHTG